MFSNNKEVAINDGATPNETTSANESNSLPIAPLTFNALAVKPSQKSNNAPQIMNTEASKGCFHNKRATIDNTPQRKFIKVIVFGICFFIKCNV